MIVGHGAIASVLRDRPDRIYFASGVANSLETREAEYERERALLLSQGKLERLIYFSSLCVFGDGTRYSQHKRQMEELIKREFPKYCIMRLGNIDWATNSAQLIPFIKNCLTNKTPMRLFDECRHVLGKEEFLYWVNRIPDWNCEMNITGELIRVPDLMARYQSSWSALA